MRVVGGAQLVAARGARDQVVERALVEHAAGADDRHAVAQLLDLGHQVAREQDRDALVGEPRISRRMSRMPTGSRPVVGSSSSSSRGRSSASGDAEALAHAVRVAADLVLGPVGEVDGVERLADPSCGSVAVERRHQLEVAAARQIRVEARRLDEAGDAVERGRTLQERVAPEQPRRALVGPDQAEQHPQRRRLACSVGPEVAVDVTGADREVDVVDGGDLAVALDQPAGLDRRCHHRPRAAFSAATGGTEPSTV